ncbi:MAG: hypothetical protein ACOZNI_01525 [Myxococcota bacterium]
MLPLALGCAGEPPDPGPTFSTLADSIEEGPLYAAWSDGDVLLAVGGRGEVGTLARWDGEGLCVDVVADRALWWIHGPREGEWLAVGERGAVLHEIDGERVREDVPTDATLFGTWVDGDVAWAVGGAFSADGSTGEVWVRRDGAWSALATDLPAAAFKVWDGWIVGDGAAWRLDGDTLVPVDAGGGRLLTVRGRADDDVWAVGGGTSATVRRWDGEAWSDVDATALGQPLAGVWTGPGEDVWVAGNFGTAAVLRDDGWEIAPPADPHWHAAWRHGDETFWVGGDLFGTRDGAGAILRYGDGEVAAGACP